MARPARKLTRRSASLLLVALFLVLATVVGLASYGVELGSLILGGMQTAVRGVGSALATAVESVGAYGKALVYARGIYAENDSLRLENQYLSAQLSTAKDDAAELARLQAQLGLQQGLAVKTVLAQVTGRTTNLGSLDVFIDHGSSTGVAAGAGVFAPDPADWTGLCVRQGPLRLEVNGCRPLAARQQVRDIGHQPSHRGGCARQGC